jgi:flavin-dependent dehydrogenase
VKSPARQHAIVIGAGAAGCLAARVLSDHFEQVTILDRDTEASSRDRIRRGIPQANHVHNVLLLGNRILEKLFPDFFGDEFAQARAPEIEVSQDQRMLGPFGWNPFYPTGWRFRGYSRKLFDRVLIQETQKLANVKILFGQDVQGLLLSTSRRVEGVVTQNQTLTADLIVEASGRGTKLEHWLNQADAGTLPVRRVATPDGYATRIYRLDGEPPEWKQFAILRKPPERTRGAYILSVEENRWIVTLVGGQGDFPPGDEDGFLKFAQSLATSDVIDFLKRAVPEDKIHIYRKMENVCRLVHRTPNWPDNLIVMGDALCTFNPVYGQGITTAAVSAMYLKKTLLRANGPGWERRFHRSLIRILAAPWLLSVRQDLIGPEASTWLGRRLSQLRHALRLRILFMLQKAAPHDRLIHLRLYEVQNLMRPIHALYSPRLIWRSLVRKRRHSTFAAPSSDVDVFKRSA